MICPGKSNKDKNNANGQKKEIYDVVWAPLERGKMSISLHLLCIDVSFRFK
jgi:hypothetical protein